VNISEFAVRRPVTTAVIVIGVLVFWRHRAEQAQH
jgi:hypothetical protein